MAKQTQNPGATLKKQIGANEVYTKIPLEELFCEKDRELTEANIPLRERPALQVLAAYKRQQDKIAYSGTLSELVYFFMGGQLWTDRLHDYRQAAVSMLVALADIDFNTKFEEKIGWSAKSDLVHLLEKTLMFMRGLEETGCKPLLLMHEIINTDVTDERLQQIEDEYEARLEMALSGRHRFE